MFERIGDHGTPPPPGPATATLLAEVDAAGLDDVGLLDAAVAAYRHVAWAQAAMYTVLGELHRRFRAEEPYPDGSREPMLDVANELAPAIAVAPGTASGIVDLAISLTERLPRALEAMTRGDLDATKAKVLADVTRDLSPEARRRVETVAVDHAQKRSARQLRRKLNDAAIRVDPQAAEKRRQRACERRRVDHWAEPDGQAVLHIEGPAEKTTAIFSIIDKIAHRQRPEGDTRTLDQRRFDALYDLVVHGADGVAGELQVVIAAETLLGLDDRPALLKGYGSITADAARAFAQDARWRRLLTDPVEGYLLDVSTTAYRPPKHLERFVKLRDVTCVEPTCDRDARLTQVDHSINHPEGPTAEFNLGCLCVRIHQPKTRKRIFLEQVEPGVFRWTTKLGRVYEVDRRPLLDFTGPDDGSIDPGTGKPDPRKTRLEPADPEPDDPGDPPF
ncbi:MAG: DUF222 domain-containing protein [Actinomycetota bacterium]